MFARFDGSFFRKILYSILIAGLLTSTVQLPAASADDFGTWTARDANRDWFSIVSSTDGTKLLATVNTGRLYTSTDSGVTWTARESSRDWWGAATSSDGTKLVATENSGNIFTSTDSGATWTARESVRNWTGVASSSDGTKLVAVVTNGRIYTSTDSGVTWTPRDSNRDWYRVTSSSDGTKLLATVNSGNLYTSTDSGVTWTPRDAVRNWYDVASSSDGTKLIASVNGGYLYTSVDSGLTWTQRASSHSWVGVASSSDGTRLVAVNNGGNIYTSGDSGATWTSRAFTADWWGAASSGNGLKVFVDVSGGQIYTSGSSLTSATLDSLSYAHDAAGGTGKLIWSGSGIEAVKFGGPACLYPAPFNHGTFTATWDGTLVNLEPGKNYSFTITVISKDGVGESRTLEVTTPTASSTAVDLSVDLTCARTNKSPTLVASGTINEIRYLITRIVSSKSETSALTAAFTQLETVWLNTATNSIRLPRFTALNVSATSLTPSICSASGLFVTPLAKGECSISYTAAGKSGHSFTTTKTFTF